MADDDEGTRLPPERLVATQNADRSAVPQVDLSGRPGLDRDGRQRVDGHGRHREPEDVAALLRERIYGDIACLSTLLVLTNDIEDISGVWSAVLDVAVATGGLFAASALAEFVAHLGTHGRAPRGRELAHLFRTSGQILEAAALPVLLLLLSAVGVISLHTALWLSVWLLIVALGLFALLAARRTNLAWWGKLLLVAVLVGLGVVVVAVKMLAH